MSETFFNRSAQETLDELHTSPSGLSTAEAESRTKTFGPNKLSEGRKKSVAVVFLEQFKDLLVVILTIAAIISLLSGESESTIVIFAGLLLNAVLGTCLLYTSAPMPAVKPLP